MLTEIAVSEQEESAFDLSSIGLEGYTLLIANEGCTIYSENFHIEVPVTCTSIASLGEIQDQNVLLRDEDSSIILLISSEQVQIIDDILRESNLNQWQVEPI